MIVPFTIPIEGKKCVVTQYDNVALVFAEEINDELCRFVDISTKEEVSVIILSLRRDFPASFQSSVTCLYLRDEDFSDSIIKEKYCIRFVFGVGVNGQATAHNFSVKNKGVTRITNSEAYKRMIRGIGKSILLKTYDGLGDLIMLTPSAKAWYNKGYSVDILTIPERQGVVDGLHYIRKVYYDEKEVTYGSYKKIYDISGKISEYSQSYCRQHRVFTIANLVGLSNDEVSKDMLPDLPARDINILSTKASNME